MNEIISFSLIILTVLRILGLGVTFDYYLDFREKKYIKLIIGWILWIISGFVPLTLDFLSINIVGYFLFLNVMFALIGGFLIFIWIFSNFFYISEKTFWFLLLILIISPITIFIFTNAEFAVANTGRILFLLYLLFILLTILKTKDIKRIIKHKITYFYITTIFVLFFIPISLLALWRNYNYGLYQVSDEFLISLNYLNGIAFTIMILVMFINLEQGIILTLKEQLKDKYSHDLGNMLQIIYSASYIIEINKDLQIGDKKRIYIIHENCTTISNLIKQVRNL
jgi:hypothetical protein